MITKNLGLKHHWKLFLISVSTPIFLFFLCMFFIGTTVGLIVKSNTYKEILKVGTIDATSSTDGLARYENANLEYENHNYLAVVQSCTQARDKFSIYMQLLREAKAGLNTNVKVMNIYSQMLDEEISIYNNLYEACEHFESANRYYNTYYNHQGTDTDYTMGTNEIDMMNEKINAHDSAVERYNNLLAQYSVELKKLIGE